MRILLTHKLWQLTGGAEVFFRETERVLREAGHETLMVATGSKDGSEPDNLVLLDAPAYDSGGTLEKVRALPSAIYDRGKRATFERLIEEFQPDLLHIFAINVHLSLSPIDAARAKNVPVVATFNDYKHICPNYKLYANGAICTACKGRNFHNAAIKSCCKGSRALSVASMLEAQVHHAMGMYEKIDHFTFSSTFMAEMTQEFWPERDLSWSKLRNPFQSRDHQLPADRDDFALFFGRLVDEKGVDLILDAAKDISGYAIKIIGDGPEEQRLRRRVSEEKIGNVEFLGPKWGDELDVILRRAAFVLVPSVWHENFPYVINQAFALGKPVVGSRRGGITELVEHGERGFIFDPDRPGEFAAAIDRLASSPALIETMGTNAKRWSDEIFNDEHALQALMTGYERARDAFDHRRR